jgi:hypothetical protein
MDEMTNGDSKPTGLMRRIFGRRPDAPDVPEGWTATGQFDPADVFIVGYPKSGNTWFQDLASAAVYGVTPEFCPPVLIQDLVPDIHATRFYKRYSTPMFFKSHDMPRPDFRRVVYLLRDGRDAMVSYFHHLSALQKEPVNFLEVVRTGRGLFPGKWHEHVAAWLPNPHQAQMMIIRYEDLKKDAVAELKRFCAFVGIERDEAFLAQRVASASFEKMRQREQKLGWGDPAWPKDKNFIRRGVVGGFKDEMPPEVLNEFLREARAQLQQCHYL